MSKQNLQYLERWSGDGATQKTAGTWGCGTPVDACCPATPDGVAGDPAPTASAPAPEIPNPGANVVEPGPMPNSSTEPTELELELIPV